MKNVYDQIEDLNKRGLKVDTETSLTLFRQVLAKIGELKAKQPEHSVLQTLQKLQTLKNGYDAVCDKRGRIYPQYKRTKTHRWISSSPCVQSITKHSAKQSPRACILPETGYNLLSFDYKQGEFRVLAEYVNNKALIERFNNDEDFHQIMADELKITRDKAKIVNFATYYGMSQGTLSVELNVSLPEAEAIQNKIFKVLGKGFTEFKKRVEKRDRFTTCTYNEIPLSGPPHVRLANVIQTSLADIVESAILHTYWWIGHKNLLEKIFLYMVNADELVFCAEKFLNRSVIFELKSVIENSVSLRNGIKMKVDSQLSKTNFDKGSFVKI